MAEHSRFQNLVAEAKKHITEISPQDAATKQNNDEAVVIDVREKGNRLLIYSCGL